MNFLQTYAKEIFALAVPLIAWFLDTRLGDRAKLQLGAPHNFTFIVDEPLKDPEGNVVAPNQSVHTASHVISNSGRETATKVELVFNWKPHCINIWPVRHYQDYIETDGRYVMIFDSLAPKEQQTFELLSINRDLPKLVTARSDQCIASVVQMYPTPIVAVWKQRLAVTLMFAGLSLSVYVAVLLLKFLVSTPVV